MTHKVTPETSAAVRALSSYGMPMDKIGKYLGVCSKTLRKHYTEILDRAKVDKIMQISDALYTVALAGNVPALIFYLKTQGSSMGWREEGKEEQGDKPDIGTIKIEIVNKDTDVTVT